MEATAQGSHLSFVIKRSVLQKKRQLKEKQAKSGSVRATKPRQLLPRRRNRGGVEGSEGETVAGSRLYIEVGRQREESIDRSTKGQRANCHALTRRSTTRRRPPTSTTALYSVSEPNLSLYLLRAPLNASTTVSISSPLNLLLPTFSSSSTTMHACMQAPN